VFSYLHFRYSLFYPEYNRFWIKILFAMSMDEKIKYSFENKSIKVIKWYLYFSRDLPHKKGIK
jgi:hypothetical protein